MSKWLIGFASLATVMVITISLSGRNAGSARDLHSLPDYSKVSAMVGGRKLELEVVTSPSAQALGLSGRDQIGADGLLFVFPEPRVAVFWMKDMQFSIDIVWIHRGVVVGVEKSVPFPQVSTQLSELPTYTSTKEVDMVLEVAAGQSDIFGLVPGAQVQFEQ